MDSKTNVSKYIPTAMPMIIAVKVNVEMFETFPIDFIGSVVISPGRDSSRITRGWNGHHSIAPIIQYAICNSVTESFQRCALKKKKKKKERELKRYFINTTEY